MKRRGFTLVEVILATAVSGVVLALVTTIVTTLTDNARRLDRFGSELSERMNGERWLAEAFGSAESGTPGATGLSGTETAATWTAWLQVPEGWCERGAVSLRYERGRMMLFGNGMAFLIRSGLDTAHIDYFTGSGLQGRWIGSWEAPITLPAAMRLRLVERRWGGSILVDTVLLRTGARG